MKTFFEVWVELNKINKESSILVEKNTPIYRYLEEVCDSLMKINNKTEQSNKLLRECEEIKYSLGDSFLKKEDIDNIIKLGLGSQKEAIGYSLAHAYSIVAPYFAINRFQDLKGYRIKNIDIHYGSVDDEGNDSITLHVIGMGKCELYHCKECCENVYIESIEGNISDILNEDILLAEEITGGSDHYSEKKEIDSDSYTWTFYKLSTIKGSVTIRFLGESSSFYSEKVDFSYTPTKE